MCVPKKRRLSWMQLLADVEHHYTPRLEQHPSAAAAPVSCKIEKKEVRIRLHV